MSSGLRNRREMPFRGKNRFSAIALALTLVFTLSFAPAMAAAGSCGPGPFSAFARIAGDGYQAVTRAARTMSNEMRIFAGRATKNLDEKSFAIFDKVHADPNYRLTQEEFAHLHKNDLFGLFEQYRLTGQRVQAVNRFFAASGRTKPDFKERWAKKMMNWVQMILFPMPLPMGKKNRVRALFRKFVINPELGMENLTAAERALLEDVKLLPDFERLLGERELLGSQAVTLSRIRQRGNQAAFVIFGASSVAGVAAGLSQTVGHEEVSVSESLDMNHPHGMQRWGKDLGKQFEIIYTDSRKYPVMFRIRNYFYVFTPDGTLKQMVGLDESGMAGLPSIMDDEEFLKAKHIRVQLQGFSSEEVRKIRDRMSQMIEDRTRMPPFQNWRWAHEFLCKRAELCLPIHLGQTEELSVPAMKFAKATGWLEGSEHIGKIVVAFPDDWSAAKRTEDKIWDGLGSYLGFAYSPALAPIDYGLSMLVEPKGVSDFMREFATDDEKYNAISPVTIATTKAHIGVTRTQASLYFVEKDGAVRPTLFLQGYGTQEEMAKLIAEQEAGRINIQGPQMVAAGVLDSIDPQEYFGSQIFTDLGVASSIHQYYYAKLAAYSQENPEAVYFDGVRYFKIQAGQIVDVPKPN